MRSVRQYVFPAPGPASTRSECGSASIASRCDDDGRKGRGLASGVSTRTSSRSLAPVPMTRSILLAALLAIVPPFADDPPPLRGFSAAASRTEREWEAKYKAIPEPARMREAMRRLALRPHHVGSAYGKED